MATKKISELEAITEADGSDALVIVDVSEGKTNKITKNNLLKGSGHTIEMSLNQETYALTLTLKNAEGTELSTASIDLPNENALTNISYSNGALTLTKQSGVTSTVDISGLINGLATETALTNLANALKETIGIQTNTYDNTKTYNTGDIVVQNEKIYKANQDNITGTFDSSKWDEISLYEYQKLQDEAIEENYKVITKLQEDVEDLTERVEDAENNELTNTPTPATSHYLQDSADSRFRKFIPIGRTTQESDPTPENPVPIKNTGDNVNLFDKNTIANGAIYRSNGNIDSDTLSTHQHSDYIEIEENTQYYVTIKTFPSSNYGFAFYDNSKTFISSIASANLITTPLNAKYIRICWSISGTYASDINTIKLEQGTIATPYSPYGCGNVNEKIENFNIWDEELERGKINVTTGENASSSDNMRSKNFIPINSSFTYYLYNGSLLNVASSRMLGFFYDKDKNYISNTSVNNTTFVTPTNAKYLRFFCAADYGITYKNDICINVSDTAMNGTYVPHSKQNISFPLAEGQKFYEGSHPDDDKKVHHKMGEIVLDGTVGGYNADYNWFYLSFTNLQIQKPKTLNILSNYFKYYNRNEFANDTSLNGISFNAADISTASTFVIRNTNCTNATEYKNWLAEVLPKVIYELEEEQTEDFTSEQQTAWEQIKALRTYKPVTHISSEDETPANVEIEYVVDINTIDDRITALEAKVDLLEE